MNLRHSIPLEFALRALRKCEIDANGCWVFTGALAQGYGRIHIGTFNGKRLLAQVHRLVYEHLVGTIPDGLDLDHLCRNRACCNTEHIEPVTRRTNVLRGTGPTAQHAAQTHCYQGHEFNEANTYNWRGQRHCRVCRREKMAARRAAHAQRLTAIPK